MSRQRLVADLPLIAELCPTPMSVLKSSLKLEGAYPMKLVGSSNQQIRHYMYDASGTVAAGGTAQLVLAQSQSRSFLLLQNNSAGNLWFEFGSARATATLTSDKVTSVSVTNAGFGFTKPPVVRFYGGGYELGGGKNVNPSYLGLNQPNGSSPSNPADAVAVLTTGAVSSIVVNDGGAKYVKAPFVFLFNNDLDPYGCAVPSATSGILLTAGSSPLIWNGTTCPTDPIAVFGADTGAAFVCKWMD